MEESRLNKLRKLLGKNGRYWAKRYLLHVLGIELNDKDYLDLLNCCNSGRHIEWDNPQTFNDKLNWLKLNDRNPVYNEMADKYSVKALVASKIGENYIVPNIGVYKSVEEIDYETLPNQFVIKCTHDSCGVWVCKDKSQYDWDSKKEEIKRTLNTNYYENGREWIYKDIKPRIIIDTYLNDGREGELQDYKWWCFNGEPRVMYITNKGKAGQVYENFYDMEFNVLNIDHGYPRSMPEYKKPAEFEEMKFLATKLSEGIPFVRVDFFDINGKVYFGEFTFYDHAGLRPFVSKEWDVRMGEWIDLPSNK